MFEIVIKQMNKFQIIVPTQNSYKILKKLIKSIQRQTYKNWSVIFIDGESNKSHIKFLKELCLKDKRFIYLKQNNNYKGIFGAMNQGLEIKARNSWILFWGSDDWANGVDTFDQLNKYLVKLSHLNLDLIICKGKYFKLNGNFLKNTAFSNFMNNKNINLSEYKKLLFCGLTPPHQATLMHSSIFSQKYKYNHNYQIAGDLDFFCSLCSKKNLSIYLLNLNIVSMSCGGISSKNHLKRFNEVKKSYFLLFNKFYFIPFFCRYFLKIIKIK